MTRKGRTNTSTSLAHDLHLHRKYKKSIGLLTFALDLLARRTAIEEACGLTDGGDAGSLVKQIREFLNEPVNGLIANDWRNKAKELEAEISKDDEELFNF